MPIHSFPASPSFFAVYNVAWIFDHVFVNNINVLWTLFIFYFCTELALFSAIAKPRAKQQQGKP